MTAMAQAAKHKSLEDFTATVIAICLFFPMILVIVLYTDMYIGVEVRKALAHGRSDLASVGRVVPEDARDELAQDCATLQVLALPSFPLTTVVTD